MLVYMAVIAIILTILFDLSRIASLGAIFYLIMDIGIHWGLLRKLNNQVDFHPAIVWMAILADSIVLTGFIWIKAQTDILLIAVSVILMLILFFGEKLFLSQSGNEENGHTN